MLLPSFAMLPAEPVPTSAEFAANVLGFLLWSLAYVLIIIRGFRDRSYGVPLVAICLNVTWELYFAWLCPLSEGRGKGYCTASGMWLGLLYFWLLLDAVILWQLVRYGSGRAGLEHYLPDETRRRFAFLALVIVLLFLSLAWQYSFVALAIDQDGNGLAWVTNLIMILLFIRSALTRPGLRGLSVGAAWAMLGGNLAFVTYAFLNNFAVFTPWPRQVTICLMLGVVLFNILYLVVLWSRGADLASWKAGWKVVGTWLLRPATS
jgi:hypothetical protein